MILPAMKDRLPELELIRPLRPGDEVVLSPDALGFVARLCEEFRPELEQLLARRDARQRAFDKGSVPDFDPQTRAIREGDWQVAEIPREVADRRTEITGPVSRKMVINALNSGAQVYMADFEDSTAPAWDALIDGQRNLYDAIRRQIDFSTAEGKHYALNENTAILMVRPRGLHLPEHHVRLAGRTIPGCLLDFGLYLYHNHQALLEQGSRPYFYLPKLEHYEEARWWNRVIRRSEALLGLPRGTVRVTVLIETLPAVFQMDEILHALRERMLGLNCGRWDYIFSYIKTFRQDARRVLPDREQVTMQVPFLAEYSRALIKTCHRRGAFAMGGMAAQIPVKGDEAANQAALDKVRQDKQREARNGHDGTWVAHPALEPLARTAFDEVLTGPNQIDRQLDDFEVGADRLREAPQGAITEAGMRGNIRVAIQYLAAWLAGNGCVPINHLMEDAATAEIARSQLWQWLHHDEVYLEDGRAVDAALFQQLFEAESQALREQQDSAEMHAAAAMIHQLTMADELQDFLTLPAYRRLVNA